MPLYPKAKKPDPVANGLELKTGEVGEINALKDVFVYAFLHSNLSLSLSSNYRTQPFDYFNYNFLSL